MVGAKLLFKQFSGQEPRERMLKAGLRNGCQGF